MTLTYKVLGIPKTFDEFIDKVKRKGDKQIDVVLEAYNSTGGFGHGINFNYNCDVILLAGDTEFKLNSYTHTRMGHLFQTVVGKAEIELAGLKEAVEVAERLQNLGLEAKISGRSIDEAKKAVVEYGANVNELRHNFASRL